MEQTNNINNDVMKEKQTIDWEYIVPIQLKQDLLLDSILNHVSTTFVSSYYKIWQVQSLDAEMKGIKLDSYRKCLYLEGQTDIACSDSRTIMLYSFNWFSHWKSNVVLY